MAMKISEIIREANRQGLDIRWLTEPTGKANYDKKRKIANGRFDYRPAAIAQCNSAEAVAGLFRIFRGRAPKIRVRSGGHQHEGMCSADDVLLIDLSGLNKINFDPEKGTEETIDPARKEVWLQPGVLLGDVYKTLEKYWMTLPAGGCSHVRVGGLVQGGGWGPSVRNFGLTCDSLLKAEVVLANGDKVIASERKNENPRLFWAIRGGGGGNFGVVTNCKFSIYRLADPMTTFRLYWEKKYRKAIVRTWMHRQDTVADELTTFARISVTQEREREAIFIGGQFYGSEEHLKTHLQSFYDVGRPIREVFREKKKRSAKSARGGDESSLTSAVADLIGEFQPEAPRYSARGASEAPQSTCGETDGTFVPHPHKVSSAFPTATGSYDRLAANLIAMIEKTPFDKEVNRYVSLHGFGGAVRKTACDGTAFPYREKEFMLQFQAWWSDPKNPKSDEYVKWIERFRRGLKGVEGAFINFPDISLVSDIDKERVRLLEHYYGRNLTELRKAKSQFDPGDVFSFGMSIPPKKS